MKKLLSVFGASLLGAYVYRKFIKPRLRYQSVDSYLINASEQVEKPTVETKKVVFEKRVIADSEVVSSVPTPIITANCSWGRVFVGLILVSFLGWFLQDSSYWLSSNMFKQDIPFNGTYFPIKKVPIWTALSAAERKMTYDQLPTSKLQNLPTYNPSTFQKGMNWSSGNANARNAYITYSVPFLGSYRLNGKEYNGSHPGMDIKAPKGTPVHAFANGIVTKVKRQNTGYGLHIVIAHPNVPDPKNANKKVTLYSAYAHLSAALVKEGQVVDKGDIIGKVGSSGMATANHLHLQLDSGDAPFFPYWPFSWSEIKKAGIPSYFEAVNRAFGIEKAKRYTNSPIAYHLKYKNYRAKNNTKLALNSAPKKIVKKSAPKTVSPKTVSKPAKKPVEKKKKPQYNLKPVVPNTTHTNTKYVQPSPYSEILFETGAVFLKGNENVVRVSTNDLTQFEHPVNINSTLRSLADISPKVLKKEDFKNGVAEIRVKTDSSSMFRILAEGGFGKVRSKLIKPQVFLDIQRGSKYEDAVEFLKDNNVVRGYEDGTFRPNNPLTRAQAMKLIIESNDMRMMPAENNFKDVPRNKWYTPYVSNALARGIVKGYADRTFRPNKSVTRAEFLKMALKTSDMDWKKYGNEENYNDINDSDWEAPFMKVAKKEGMFEVYDEGYVWPNKPITRAEAAYVLWKIHQKK
ncbi:hypothetical protein CSB37_02740 [bacterium DOLZORAL124_38_8]|nr:MAG: hypothetical protein CSB37_02740 [bacterium DOLZORAL124_38_8]